MDTEKFVEAIRAEVYQSAQRECIELLTKGPYGRKPQPDLVALSEWFNELPDRDRAMVKKVAKEASHAAVFGFLCVLDGVRVIEGYGPKGDLELVFVKDGSRTLLNPQPGEMLHDVFNAG
jgi:hypothetical protein